VWGERGGVVVVGGGGRVVCPVLEEHIASTVSEGLVGLSHERRGRDFGPGWKRGV